MPTNTAQHVSAVMFFSVIVRPVGRQGDRLQTPKRRYFEEPKTRYDSVNAAGNAAFRMARAMQQEAQGAAVVADVVFDHEAPQGVRVRHSLAFTLEACNGYDQSDAAQPLPALTAYDRINLGYQEMGEKRPVSYCLGCGCEGVNALRALCGECLANVPTDLREAIEAHARFRRIERGYQDDHRKAITAAALVAFTWRINRGDVTMPGETPTDSETLRNRLRADVLAGRKTLGMLPQPHRAGLTREKYGDHQIGDTGDFGEGTPDA